ncbi:leukocyte elastase inhibitor-like [Zootoca vivipara]|uniref:leukocyte elastase inhibitor-like n=1 Tax=Zootoca vivipara TaxID=8524 RepID=UPI00293BB228|nr:leukocyte elastase inhibitor-like [Zootoca vivipara]
MPGVSAYPSLASYPAWGDVARGWPELSDFTMTTLSEANAKFAIDFYHRLVHEHPCENVLFSPVNLTAAVGLLFYASGCDTAAHLEKVPDYECEKLTAVHTAFHRILAELNKPSTNYELSFANRLYGDQSIAFLQKFLYCALKLYLTEVDGADIYNAPEEVRRLINLWVEVQTHGKIQDLLPKDSFDCLAQLLHVNALYFKGQWDVKFDKELTRLTFCFPSYFSQDICTNVQLMYRKGQYNIGTIEECGVQVLEIPYRNNELSLFILLPRDCDPESLQQLEDGLSYDQLLNWSCILKPEEVEVVIPKFSLEKSVEVNAYLDLSPLTDPEKADLSGATTTEGVALTHLVHDTFIEIDEEGSEEAEAPACPRDRRPRQEPKAFLANHPFLYFVLHKCTQSFIAFGKFARPE